MLSSRVYVSYFAIARKIPYKKTFSCIRNFMKNKCRLLILCLLFLLGLFYLFGVVQPIDLADLSRWRDLLFTWAEFHPLFLFVLLGFTYITSICLSLPLSSLLCVLSGIFFPLPLAIFLGILSETIGALIFFRLIHFLLDPSTLHKKLARFQTTKQKIMQNSTYYLLFFRFSHVVPYWLINFLALALNIPRSIFVWTTALGVFPFVFLMTDAGYSIRHAFQHGHTVSVHHLFTWPMQLFLLLLGLLALTPIFIQWIKSKR